MGGKVVSTCVSGSTFLCPRTWRGSVWAPSCSSLSHLPVLSKPLHVTVFSCMKMEGFSVACGAPCTVMSLWVCFYLMSCPHLGLLYLETPILQCWTFFFIYCFDFFPFTFSLFLELNCWTFWADTLFSQVFHFLCGRHSQLPRWGLPSRFCRCIARSFVLFSLFLFYNLPFLFRGYSVSSYVRTWVSFAFSFLWSHWLLQAALCWFLELWLSFRAFTGLSGDVFVPAHLSGGLWTCGQSFSTVPFTAEGAGRAISLQHLTSCFGSLQLIQKSITPSTFLPGCLCSGGQGRDRGGCNLTNNQVRTSSSEWFPTLHWDWCPHPKRMFPSPEEKHSL